MIKTSALRTIATYALDPTVEPLPILEEGEANKAAEAFATAIERIDDKALMQEVDSAASKYVVAFEEAAFLRGIRAGARLMAELIGGEGRA